MKRLREVNWKGAMFEAVFVAVGILAAFQLDAWGKEREREGEVARALDRLGDEFRQNQRLCAFYLDASRARADAVRLVYGALASGVPPEDEETFGQGILLADVVYAPPLILGTYDEMVSTGLLRDLDDPVLKVLLSGLAADQRATAENLPYWRTGLTTLGDALREKVDFRYMDGGPDRVTYQFAPLAADRRLVNLFFEAVDTHRDMLMSGQGLCRQVDGVLSVLAGDSVGDPYAVRFPVADY